MKQHFLKAIMIAAVVLVASSCNDDDNNNGGPSQGPAGSFSGEVIDPSNGEQSTWTANPIIAEVNLFGELSIKAVNGDDTLSILVPSVEEGFYPIDINDPLANGNYYISVGASDTTVYTFNDDPTLTTAGLLTITSLDTVNNRFNADYQIAFYNPSDSTDFFILQNAVMENVSYTEETFEIGNELTGSLSLVADGTPVDFSTVAGFTLQGAITVAAAEDGDDSFPTFTMLFDENLTPGTYQLGPAFEIVLTYSTSENENFTPQSGELVVTTNANNTIQGTFFFTGVDSGNTIDITEGVFDINY